MNIDLSRRDFLKILGAGALGLVASELRLERAFAKPAQQGRMTVSGVPLYSEPAFNAKQLHLFGRDEVASIVSEVDGDNGYGNPFDKTWFKIGTDGYSYSGWIQPVDTIYQKSVYGVPPQGQLGEITVPYSDTRLAPTAYADRGYRIYYGSTHWVKNVIVVRDEKSVWYEIYDSFLHKSFYVASYDMRLIPDDELAQLSPEIPNDQKAIYVDLANQLVTAYEGEQLVFSSRCSSGAKGTRTPSGEFSTYHKGPSVHMTNQGDEVAHIYDLPGVPWCSFFTGEGNAFHGTYWHNDYGRPRSHGCVNLPSEAAKFLYRWTNPVVPPETDYLHLPGQGTYVKIT